MKLTPVLVSADVLREQVRNKAIKAFTDSFPLDLRGRKLEVKDIKVHEKDYSTEDQKTALLSEGSLTEAVKGTLVLRGADGAELSTHKNFTLAHLPWFTDRHTLIMGGNEYQVAGMVRRRPGVYTQRSGNGELKTTFNLSKGANFEVTFDPPTATFFLTYDSTNIPLYPLLRVFGATHASIASAWGDRVAAENLKNTGNKTEAAVSKLYQKLAYTSDFNAHLPYAEKLAVITKSLDSTRMDPHVTEITLGSAHDKVTNAALLAASRKLLHVHDGHEEVDDADSMAFKTYHSVDDFLAERIRLSAREYAMKVRGLMNGKTDLKGVLKPGPFTGPIKKFITSSALTAVPTGINPIELLDHSVKVTALGEGGIPSERAIPFETRLTHATHFGVLDPIRTPESGHAGVDIRATIAAHRDEEGNLYTPLRNARTNKIEFVRAGDTMKHVIAFPGQKLTGDVDVLHKGDVKKMDASKVDYQQIHVSHTYSPATTLIPGVQSVQGNRAIMGAKMQTQGLPLIHREAPLLQVKEPTGGTFEQLYGGMIVPVSTVKGTVKKIADGWIHIEPFHSVKKSDNRPIIFTKTLGPHTFNIEIAKNVRHLGDGQTKARGSSEDYGHLPGYVGPDGDALDFFVGNDPHGAIFSYEKQKRYDSPDWRTTDMKYVVGLNAADEAAFHKNCEEWNTDKVRFANLRRFKNWDDLQQHIDTRHKATP